MDDQSTAVAPERLAYTLDGFASAVGVCLRTLNYEIAAGRLTATKIGRRTLVTREHGLAWLRASARRS
jgi:hypothetical protein